MTIILYAVPMFFLLIGIELILEKVRGTHYYRVNDAISSLSQGVMSRMTGLMKQAVPITMYVIAYENLALFSLPDTWLVWLAAFVLYDFFYYWNHRLGHEVSVLWAAHVVHHSSEEYNLTTALRQTSGSFVSWIFYLPMAVVGFDPLLVISVGALNLVYQFWVHTQHVPKLGWFEWVFVSPSNHRVHHAQNQIYLDRNYGGVFIIWDRLFGSFQEELNGEKPIYGVRKALKSWNPIWTNLQVYSQLWHDSWHTRKWRDKVRVWLGRTGWRPADVEANDPLPRVDLAKFEKFDTSMTLSAKWYAISQYVVTSIITVMIMMHGASLQLAEQFGLALFVIGSLWSLGRLMENRPMALWMEIIKNLGVACIALWLTLPQWLSLSLVLGSAVGIALLVAQRVAPAQAETVSAG